MKKALMVLGFAMCATFAFAQTAHQPLKAAKDNARFSMADAKSTVDYKASIFTKEAGHDTIATFTFATASDYTIGTISANDRINDTVVGSQMCHRLAGSENIWIRYSDTTNFLTNAPTWTATLGNPEYWMAGDIVETLVPEGATDDGFAVISLMESSEVSCINSYITLPTAQNTNHNVVEVALTQDYRKYYDQCFIDYKGNDGKWYACEVNVTGIDCEVNGFAAATKRFTMPLAMANLNTIELRLRMFGDPVTFTDDDTGETEASYGYFWAVDNVAIVLNTNSYSWAISNRTYLDGFYGMIPQGMSIPLTFGANARNLNVNDIQGAHATAYASSTGVEGFEMVAQGADVTIPQGDISTAYPMYINERNLVNHDYPVDQMRYQNQGGWENGVYGTEGLPNGYQGRSLPTTTPSSATTTNLYTVTMESNPTAGLVAPSDTMAYTVSTMVPHSATREGGYRWGRDNGLISSHNTPFRYAIKNGLISESDELNHHTKAGYEVFVRFVTPSVLPEGWVLRGVEMLTSTRGQDVRDDKMVGAEVLPVVYKENEEMGLSMVETGASNAHVVTASEVSDTMGYILPGQNYKAVSVTIPEQITLEPNTPYLIGYELSEDAQFMLAAANPNTLRYRQGDSLYSLRRNAETYYYGTNVPVPANVYDVVAWDNVAGRGIYGWNIDYFPMIRPIVGPARPVTLRDIVLHCHASESGEHQTTAAIETRDAHYDCEDVFTITEGASKAMWFLPNEDNCVIDSVLINGVKLEVGEDPDQMTAHDYNVEGGDDEDTYVALYRSYYSYTLYAAAGDGVNDYGIDIYTTWRALGIDPVAPEVSLKLAPNPATSTVKLNLTGVTGKVNCNIIDMSGRVIYNASINAETEHTINVSNIPAGAYFVRVTNDTFSKIEKLIIK